MCFEELGFSRFPPIVVSTISVDGKVCCKGTLWIGKDEKEGMLHAGGVGSAAKADEVGRLGIGISGKPLKDGGCSGTMGTPVMFVVAFWAYGTKQGEKLSS